jgi:hypothetical protein
VLLNWSRAVTVKLNAVFGLALAGALTVKCVADAAPTLIALLVPLIDVLALSVPVIVCWPAVFIVALKVPTPLVNAVSAGNPACRSVVVKWIVPV